MRNVFHHAALAYAFIKTSSWVSRRGGDQKYGKSMGAPLTFLHVALRNVKRKKRRSLSNKKRNEAVDDLIEQLQRLIKEVKDIARDYHEDVLRALSEE
ncbi:hypothetical protein J7L27_05160 [Candidatus Bathyarchaeota archaeon]|nr:hypothetical protein [Candidatus Bathyarchaeota archaeon]